MRSSTSTSTRTARPSTPTSRPRACDSKQISSGGRGATPAPPKTAVERDKELDKGRKEAAEKAKKAGDETEKQAQNEQRCGSTRSNYQMYGDGGRIQKTNEKGERELLSDAEIEAAREKRTPRDGGGVQEIAPALRLALLAALALLHRYLPSHSVKRKPVPPSASR